MISRKNQRGFLLNPFRYGVAGGDPYFSNVSLLLHGQGTNGSTTIVDSSSANRTATVVGNTQISTAESVYGSSSIAFDGAGDRLTYTSSAAFNLGATFTIEFWMYLLALPVGNMVRPLLFGVNNSPSALAFHLLPNGTMNIAVPFGAQPNLDSGSGAAVINTWQHWAVTCSSGNGDLLLDGASIDTNSITTQSSSGGEQLFIGYDTVGTVDAPLDGYIMDLRITKGIARTIVVPTDYYPDF